MNYILHYTSIESDDEYIVITDEDESTWDDEFCMTGYELNSYYPIDNVGILPTNRVLIAK